MYNSKKLIAFLGRNSPGARATTVFLRYTVLNARAAALGRAILLTPAAISAAECVTLTATDVQSLGGRVCGKYGVAAYLKTNSGLYVEATLRTSHARHTAHQYDCLH